MSTDPVESSRGTERARSAAAGPASERGAAVERTTVAPNTSQRPNYGRDALGLVLLLLACFFGVAVVMAYLDPKEQASGMTGLVMALVDTLGASAMFLAAGLGWIGFRLWIRGVDGKVGRDLLGVVITTLTLAVLIGALSPELGGRVGSVGAMVSHRLTVFVGLIFGVIVVLLPAWFLWLKPAALAVGELPRTSAPLAPRASDSSGVTQAEAEGLLPKASPRPPSVQLSATSLAQPAVAAKQPSAAGPFASSAVDERTARRDASPDVAKLSPPKVVAPSPYPPDVRREGRVPEGARPLDPSPSSFPQPRSTPPPAAPIHAPKPRHEPLPAELPRDAAAVRARSAADAAVVGGSADLRRAVPPAVVDGDAGQRGPTHQPVLERSGLAAGGDAPSGALNLAPEREHVDEPQTFADSLASARAIAEPSLAQPLDRTPPKPSWEQSELFEEPVDAYGTPLSLVEKLRAPGEETPAVAVAEAAAPWNEEDLGDEVFEDSVKPLASAAATTVEPERAPEVVIEIVVASEELPEVASEPEPAVVIAPEDSREFLREGLRGFIDLRERLAEPTEATLESPSDEHEAPTPVSAPLAAAPELERTPAPIEVAEPLEPQAEELRAESDADSLVAPEAPADRVEPVETHAETSVHAAPKTAVVIHSLFEEELAAPAPAPESAVAPAVEPAPAAIEPAQASATQPAHVSPIEPAADALLDATSEPEAGVPHPDTDVVLEPARRSKRKAKAQRAQSRESDALASADEPRARVELSPEPAGADDAAPAAQPSVAASREESDLASAAQFASDSSSEREVELTPARPRSESRFTVDEVVFKAGCLFVNRQRVAVSMLQREFGLDFDAATSVLDQLQRVGLIGPYLGGQRRDILMTMDEWQELVGVE